jgi:hypothetical protein
MKSPAFLQRLACLAGFLALLPAISAGDLLLTEARLNAAGHFQVTAPADVTSYYVLVRSGGLGLLQTPVALALGTSAPVTITDPAAVENRFASFYRLQQVPLAQPLDTDGDGIDDVFELQHPGILNPLRSADAAEDFDGDGSSNLAEYRAGSALDRDSRPTTITTSPFAGEDGVSVNRETVLRFSRPLAADTLLQKDDLYAEYGGRRLLTRTELSSDRRTVTLFYLEPLPGSTRVRVWFEGNVVHDAAGDLVDADADGRPGGRLALDFETANVTSVANTAIIGRVFASELTPSPTGQQSLNRPLAGVTVTVDGREETMRTVTDANGNFRLEPAPVGRFFVHVDGRTSPLSHWPDGDYYPVVGKAWEAVAGRADNLASGTGEIFLPLIRAGSLQTVSALTETRIELPPAVAAANPDLAGTEIMVPANSLYSESGARGGKIGLAPVAPDRLPEPLPPGLNLPLVITVQSDGGQNFDRPVPVRFPNLPDPTTGLPLPAGSRSALWSFNHDLGRWEVVGGMMVTADGRFVETLPGVGIRQPGWHGQNPGCPLYKRLNTKPKRRPAPPQDPPPREPKQCEESEERQQRRDNARTAWEDCSRPTQSEQQLNRLRRQLSDSLRTMRRETDTLRNAIAGAIPSKAKKLIADATARIIAANDRATDAAQGLNHLPGSLCANLSGMRDCLEEAGRNAQENCHGPMGCKLDNVDAEMCRHLGNIRRRTQEFNEAARAACNQGDPFGRVLSQYLDAQHQLNEFRKQVSDGANRKIAPAGQRPLGATEDTLMEELDQIIARLEQGVNSGFAPMDSLLSLVEEFRAEERGIRELALEYAASQYGVVENSVYYAIELPDGIVRGRSSASGTFEVILPPDTAYRIHLYDPETQSYGSTDDRTGAAGVRAALPSVPWVEAELPDTDGDGLPDEAEFVIGTSPTLADSDHDGLSDGSEVAAGTNPLDGRPAAVGVLSALPLPGEARQVVVAEGLAAVALADSGVALINVFGGLNPTVIGSVATPGGATVLALGRKVLAVASGVQGLALIDITDPAVAHVSRQVKLSDAVTAVAIRGNRVYAGTAGGEVVTLDALSGEILNRLRVGSSIRRLLFGGNQLYATMANSVAILRTTAVGVSYVNSFYPSIPAGMEIRDLFVADGIAWVTYPKGTITFDVGNPAAPQPLHVTETTAFGWKQSVLNGTGLMLAAVGRNSTIENPAGDHDVSLYRVSGPGADPALIATLPTAGIAQSLALFNGRAYVADGANGLLVLNYLATELGTTPPTVAVRVGTGNGPVESGKFVTASAAANDDVQVRNVEFYLDGELAATAGGPPFEQTLAAPLLTPTKTDFVVRAKAFDTAGNAAWSEPVTVSLAEDLTPPELVRISPANAAGREDLRQISAVFSEPISHASVNTESFRLRNAGPDLTFDTADDTFVAGGGLSFDDPNNAVYLQFDPPLPAGRYRVELATTLIDRAGLPLTAAATSETFTGYGLQAEYSQLGTFEPLALLLSRLDANVDFDWNFTGPDPSVGGTFFARWRGQITPRFSETYEFALPQAEGSTLRRLWVDGQLLFDDRFFAAEVQRGSVFLQAGRGHDLLLELGFAGSGRTRLTWSSPSQPEETVPFSQLRPGVSTRPPALLAALGEPTLDRIFLRFDQALDRAEAGSVSNYVLTPPTPVRTATLLANGRDVELLTAPLPDNTPYTVRITSDRLGTGAGTFTTARLVPGAVRRELYLVTGFNDPVTASPGWPVFPYSAANLPSFANTPNGSGNDANRALAFLQPAANSTRILALAASPGTSVLFAEPDGAESTVLNFPLVNPPFFQVSDALRLEAGRRYRLDLRGAVGFSAPRFSLSTALAPAYGDALGVEVEDYDFDGGQHAASASGHPYVPGQYANRAGRPEVDFHATESLVNRYRPVPADQPTLADDSPGLHGGVRVTNNYSLSSGIAGDWLNYTRTFGAGRYRVYLAFTATAYQFNYRLGHVTAGAGTVTQTVTDLGGFAAGEFGNQIVRLLDNAGQAVELDLAGLTTLRLTAAGPGDRGPDYLLFVPVADAPADPLALLPPTPQDPPWSGPELLAPVPADGTGFLVRETWIGVTATTLAEFRASPAAQQPPTETGLINSFEIPAFTSFQPSVTRLHGWVVPYRSGAHRFFVSARRPAELFLSPDEQPAHLALVATEPVGTATARSWFKGTPSSRNPDAPENWSPVVDLVAGRRYAVEVWVRHGDGSDHVGVAWQAPETLQPANGAEPISGLHLVAPEQP